MDVIKCFRGSTLNVEAEITDDNNAVVDLAGGTIRLIVKENKGDTDVNAKFDVSVTSFDDPASGIQVIPIPPATTNTLSEGLYYAQIKFTDSTSAVEFDEIFNIRIKDKMYD